MIRRMQLPIFLSLFICIVMSCKQTQQDHSYLYSSDSVNDEEVDDFDIQDISRNIDEGIDIGANDPVLSSASVCFNCLQTNGTSLTNGAKVIYNLLSGIVTGVYEDSGMVLGGLKWLGVEGVRLVWNAGAIANDNYIMPLLGKEGGARQAMHDYGWVPTDEALGEKVYTASEWIKANGPAMIEFADTIRKNPSILQQVSEEVVSFLTTIYFSTVDGMASTNCSQINTFMTETLPNLVGQIGYESIFTVALALVGGVGAGAKIAQVIAKLSVKLNKLAGTARAVLQKIINGIKLVVQRIILVTKKVFKVASDTYQDILFSMGKTMNFSTLHMRKIEEANRRLDLPNMQLADLHRPLGGKGGFTNVDDRNSILGMLCGSRPAKVSYKFYANAIAEPPGCNAVSDLNKLLIKYADNLQKWGFEYGWIEKDLYRKLNGYAGPENTKKFVRALQHGVADSATGTSGIKILDLTHPHPNLPAGYTHEIKITGSAARLLGRVENVKVGSRQRIVLIFDRYAASGLH